MSVAVISRCDNCGEEAHDFLLPQKFGNVEAGIEIDISVLKSSKDAKKQIGSLDYCRRCFTNLLVTFAIQVAPAGVFIKWEEERWQPAAKSEPARRLSS